MSASTTRKVQLTAQLVGRAILVTNDRGNTPAAARGVPEGLYPAQDASVTRPAVIRRYTEVIRGDETVVVLDTTEGTMTGLPLRPLVILARPPAG